MNDADIHILVVEDSKIHVAMIRQAFASRNRKVKLTELGSLAEARASLSKTTPDLAIVDLLLPDGKGTELLPKDPDAALFPVVMLTGHGDEKVAVEAMKAGALDYVVKSKGTLPEIPRIVERALREWAHIQERRRAEKKVRSERAFLQAVVDGVANPIMVIGLDHRVKMLNRAAREHTLGPALSSGPPLCHQVSHHLEQPCSHNHAHRICPLEEIRKTGKTVTLVHRGETGKCENRSYEVTAFPLWNEEGTLQGIIKSSRDITDRHQAEKAIQALVESTVGSTGQECFDKVAGELCKWLDADCALVGEIVAGTHVRALSMQSDGKRSTGRIYPLKGTPGEKAVQERYCFYPEGVCELFPGDRELSRLNAKGFVGVSLQDREDNTTGIIHVVSSRKMALPDGAKNVLAIIAARVASEIERTLTEKMLRMNEEHLDFLAHYDALTALPNRLLFQDRLRQAMVKARRASQQVALLSLDLDRFKNVNDSLGHEIGDRLLREVAGRLRTSLREGDTVARLGGDEFLIILEETTDVQQIASVAKRILARLGQDITVGRHQLCVTGSIGISLFPFDGEDGQTLLKCADVALHHAKEQGRGNCQFYTPEMNSRVHEVLLLERDLRKALEQKQLFLQYQPQVDLSSGTPVGIEALVRWRHPQKALVPPADFIPMAEDTGLIVPIGEWILRAACEQNRAWQDGGCRPLRIAVNISARQFKQPDFIAMVDRVLEETGLDPQWLELEITESILMENIGASILTLSELRARGVHLAIDDFGTGYSSLNYLKRFPIHKLKIDRSFVQDVTTNPDDAAIASSVIALARSMNLDVIAEGVETVEQARFLREKGCPKGQGFLFSRPLSAEACTRLLRNPGAAGEKG